MNKILIAIVVIIILAGIIIFGGFFSNNSNDSNNMDSRSLKVAATIFPLCDIVKNIGGDNIDVKCILPPGASPHYFEFTPKKIKELGGVMVVFSIGHGVDDWAADIAKTLGSAESFVATEVVDSGITLRKSTNEEEGLDDPHYWLNFNNAKIIVDNVERALSGFDPSNEEKYQNNALEYKAKLDSQEQESKDVLSSLANRNIVTLHDAWYYFADNFNLNIIGTFEPSAGEEPSPQYLAQLRKAVMDNEVKIIFSEPQLSSVGIQSLVEDLSLGVANLDPLGGVTGRESFLELMSYNVHSVFDALNANSGDK